MKIDSFTNCYSISKTLRFKLIPQGNTKQKINEKLLLENDKELAQDYVDVKKIIDNYHKVFISRVLSDIKLSGLVQYAEIYYGNAETRSDLLENQAKKLYSEIKSKFDNDEEFKILFGKDFIKKVLMNWDKLNDDDKNKVGRFEKFTTYFTGFYENRKNIYSTEGKSTEIVNRLFNQNLPKFLDNCKLKDQIIGILPKGINEQLKVVLGNNKIEDIFEVEYFNNVLTQEGIDKYNQIIGGFVSDDGETKIQGINEIVNIHNQVSDKKLPKLKVLYKQILSDRTSVSYLPEKFSDDEMLLNSIKAYWTGDGEICAQKGVKKLTEMFNNMSEYDSDKLYVSADKLADLSRILGEEWSYLNNLFSKEYDAQKKKDKERNIDSFEKKKTEYFKKKKTYSLAEILSISDGIDMVEKFAAVVNEKARSIEKTYSEFLDFANQSLDRKLIQNGEAKRIIKAFLDTVKELQYVINMFYEDGTGDASFYADYTYNKEMVDEINQLYNKCRNYLTQKPYSGEKIKLNFGNSQLLDGWDKNKEEACLSILLKKGDKYFLGIMDKDNNKSFRNIQKGDGDCYEKMVYKQIPNASKYLSGKQILPQNPPADIVNILAKKKEDNKSLSKAEITRFIDYLANDFLVNYPVLIDENGNNYFDFIFKNPEEYNSVNEFFIDVDKQGYSVKFADVSASYIDSLVEDGKLYLFQIYCKDFSKYSKGVKNLHTLYFLSLFDKENLRNPIVALNGGGEIFYRAASLPSDEVTHPKNQPIANKTYQYKTGESKKESIFEYDLVKDKRFRYDQFTLHFPITINCNAKGKSNINEQVRNELQKCNDNYVIGIDRGERNLLYISVINGKGDIVEQFSLNKMLTGKDNDIELDYHAMLEKREKDRTEQRRSWESIDNIKQFKEGYLSAVIKKICDLMVKYDAVIAMEDLNFGFKNSRSKFERSVYEQFEKGLIDKLNYMVDKGKLSTERGGVLNGYQLSNKFEGFNKMGKQSGFIFYVPAWNTSKIDPVTGFVDLLKPKYKSVDGSKEFIRKFDAIRYNSIENYFEFDFNYDNFDNGSISYKKDWTICTNGERILTFRNSMGQWDNKKVILTDEFINLFVDNKVDYTQNNLKELILAKDEKDFFERLMKLLALTLQLRNSITNTDIDYLISPVKNKEDKFFDSRNVRSDMPIDADANGAYNIARKGLWIIEQIKKDANAKLAISNKEWLEFAQK